MMKNEFEERLHDITGISCSVSDKDYQLIEYIYTFHPSISDTEGKRQVAQLYNDFGIRIFMDMKPTADRNRQLDVEIGRARHHLEALLDEANELRRGGCS